MIENIEPEKVKIIKDVFLEVKKSYLLIKKWGSTDLKHFNDSKAFIEYSNDLDDICKTIKNKPHINNVKY